MPRSLHGGRHELGQNFLVHRPTLEQIADLVPRDGTSVLELGAGDGALTRVLAARGVPLTALEIDEHRARALRRKLPGARVIAADALTHPLEAATIVGNIPFHLTTPILRRLLRERSWRRAVLLTQWEVARKRAGVGGSTLLTVQAAPWIRARLEGRVPSRAFRPAPSVDGGILVLGRREHPLLPLRERAAYERFARCVFAGGGGTLERILPRALPPRGASGRRRIDDALRAAGVARRDRPRDLAPRQWALLWKRLGRAPRD
ncbi:23S ribosomal RNA methyltransferase Erm [Brachybacterium sp. MASK1Z-5]|uniref:23S ribosomal RNA methyltransferase Erm n=1 Tax=Brachybacterium halotolerans TaxID=2795215 RepID=A0ABS1B8V0_9MICO|nr:23S ribosomal RNA methyltransferase Erm [Brachybacterium halotolerans]MBK0331068.1 23S ribosomal RNA methyltransferase Erm [Brachybacterium halotolerans]